MNSVDAADESGNGGGVWPGLAGDCGVVVAAAAVCPLPPVCCLTAPCP